MASKPLTPTQRLEAIRKVVDDDEVDNLSHTELVTMMRDFTNKKKSVYGQHMRRIQNRTEAKDVFYTPHAIAEKMVEMADIRTGDRVLEPCRGDGAIFDLLPDDSVNLWCEIALGRDFYQFDDPVDVVIANPPFSHYSPFLQHILELNPRTIVLLGDSSKFTQNRMILLMKNGYTLTKQHNCYWSVCIPSKICVLMCFERLEYDADVNIITTWDYRMHGPARSQKQQRNRSALRLVVDEFLNQETTEHADLDELTEQLDELLLSTKEEKVFEEKNKSSLSSPTKRNIKVLELFSGTGSVGRICKHLGWEVISLDLNNADINTDILDWDYTIFEPGHFDIIWASPPCNTFSHLANTRIGLTTKGIEGIVTKEKLDERMMNVGVPILEKTLEIIDYLSPETWFLENPQTGRMKEFMTGYDFFDVDYCQYGFSYRKRTRIWTNKVEFSAMKCDPATCKFMKDNKHFISLYNGSETTLQERYSIPSRLILSLLPYVNEEDIETLACEIDVMKIEEEQGAPSKAIRDIVLHNAGLSRQNRTSLSQEDKKQKRKKAKKKSKLVIVDELGLSRPVQQRSLSDEAKSLLNETL